MVIGKISVTYGELRSTGFPSFSNQRIETTMEAILQPSDNEFEARAILYERCRAYVRAKFGDKGYAEDFVAIPRELHDDLVAVKERLQTFDGGK